MQRGSHLQNCPKSGQQRSHHLKYLYLYWKTPSIDFYIIYRISHGNCKGLSWCYCATTTTTKKKVTIKDQHHYCWIKSMCRQLYDISRHYGIKYMYYNSDHCLIKHKRRMVFEQRKYHAWDSLKDENISQRIRHKNMKWIYLQILRRLSWLIS